MRVEVATEKETETLAKGLARLIRPGMNVGLIGQLGAGKTAFARYLMRALGVSGPIASPSFVLSFDYQASAGLQIEHWDLYRLRELPEDLYEPLGEQTMRLIEWADRVAGFSEKLDLVIEIEFLERDYSGRVFEFSGRLAEKLAAVLKLSPA